MADEPLSPAECILPPLSRIAVLRLRPLPALFLAALCVGAGVAAAQPVLRTDGRFLRDGAGKVVVLRGVNLGGWLEWQRWMCPVDPANALRDANPGHNGYNFEVRRLLEKRFGRATAEDLVNTYLDAWISAADLDWIKATGMNAVRLPLAHDTFLHEDGRWRDDAFTRVDWLVAEAWKRGIYTILDYHAFLPPAANQDGGPDGYWASEAQQAETIRVWEKIAAHYRGNPAVAMYDLLNEPNNSQLHQRPGPSAQSIRNLYHRLEQAIRKIDPDHIIAMEGLWDWRSLRDPREAGYRNFVVSLHWYEWNEITTEDRNRATDRNIAKALELFREWQVPLYVGEFNLFGDPRAWEHALEQFDRHGINWTLWNHKHKASGSNSWGMLTTIPGKAPAEPNLANDSAEQIRAKWRAWKTSPEHFAPNPMLHPILVKTLR